MTKQEAKRWVCSMAADLLTSDLDMGEVVDLSGENPTPDERRKAEAFKELITELRRRGAKAND